MAIDRNPDEPLITFTDSARDKLLEILDEQNLRGTGAVRISILGRGASGFEYGMNLEPEGEPQAGDATFQVGDLRVFVDAESASLVGGATVDFADQLMGGGFRIDNPNPTWTDPLAQSIQQLIDEQINPAVASHGGHVSLLDVKDNLVFVRLGGGCQGCGMVDVTLRQGIEALIQQEYPQIIRVIDQTDHAGGDNPFYQPAKGAPEGAASPFHQPAKG
jgi:Fe/S biogenesis protein NfuA